MSLNAFDRLGADRPGAPVRLGCRRSPIRRRARTVHRNRRTAVARPARVTGAGPPSPRPRRCPVRDGRAGRRRPHRARDRRRGIRRWRQCRLRTGPNHLHRPPLDCFRRPNHRPGLASALRRRVPADAGRLAHPRPGADHQRYRDPSGSSPSSAVNRRSRSGRWPFSSLDRACATENQPTRSISGYSLIFPEPFGHSSSKVLLTVPSRSRSPRTANAVMILPLGCSQRREVDARAVGRRLAEFLFELALRRGPGIFALGVLTLGNRPRTVVLARPERSAGMPDEHLDDAVGDPVQQQTRAEFGHLTCLPRACSPCPRVCAAHASWVTDVRVGCFCRVTETSGGRFSLPGATG